MAHVESVSGTIAQHLGLNTELTKAIAIGHDLGHAPFGHHVELLEDDNSKATNTFELKKKGGLFENIRKSL